MLKKCRSCDSENLQDILSLGVQYLSDFVDTNDQKPEKYPLDLIICQNCYLVQLKHTTPQSSLYTENYGYKSGINNTIKADLQDIVEKALMEVNFKEGDLWLSIGENDGTLLTFVPDYAIKVACEPIKKLAEECKTKADVIINDFWSYESYEKAIANEKMSNMQKRNITKKVAHGKELA